MNIKKKNPSPVHRMMLDSAIKTRKIKELNLREIGETVATHFERAKPYSRQYVDQVLQRWANFYEDWQGYDAARPTISQMKKAKSYAAGKKFDKNKVNYDVLKKLGFKLRGMGKGRHFTMKRKIRLEKEIIPMSNDWKSGMPVKQIADKWNLDFQVLNQKINRYRYKYNRLDLFPYRRFSHKKQEYFG